MMKAILVMLFCPCLLLVYLFFFYQDESDQVCAGADRSPCPDLLRAEVSVVIHEGIDSLWAACVLPEIDACAIRTASWGEAHCVIHQLASAPAQVFEHEMNHCRGWDHEGTGVAAYAQPWQVNRGLWLARGANQ